MHAVNAHVCVAVGLGLGVGRQVLSADGKEALYSVGGGEAEMPVLFALYASLRR